MRRVLLVLVIAVGLGGIATASGSFSVTLKPVTLELEANLEQEITRVGPWTIYAGSGFAVDADGLRKLQPYTLACASLDVVLAYSEACIEVRAPIVGQGDIARVFLTVAW